MPTSLTDERRDRRWEFLEEQFNDKSNPWRAFVLEQLCESYSWDKKRVQPLLEKVLESPGDSAIGEALLEYGRFAAKPEVFARLSAMMTDNNYSAGVRSAARSALEGAFPNPFLQIEVEDEGRDPSGRLAPLKLVDSGTSPHR